MDMLQPTLDHDVCHRALTARDARFDGLFFVGVKSTGIYCRPVCRARTPKPSSCHFFANAAAAEKAGFRPCLLCRPELAPYPLAANLARQIAQRIAEGAMNEGGLEALARIAGLSSRQLRRLMVQQLGVTPVELAQTHRLLLAKKLLQETGLPIAQVAHAAGFGSLRRFNALFSQRYRLSPGALRNSAGGSAATDVLTLRLDYRPPLAWRAMLQWLAPRALGGVEQVDLAAKTPSWARSVRVDGRQGWVRLCHDDRAGQLRLQMAPALLPILPQLIARVRRLFDLDANPALVLSHLASDRLLAPLLAQLPDLRVPGAFDTFELAVRAVLGQQVSVAGASTLCERLIRAFGDEADLPVPGVTRHFPLPQQLAAVDTADLAAQGLPRKRAETLRHLARAWTAGTLTPVPGASLDAVLAQWRAIPGIGDWTANYIALRALRQPDAFPAGDLGLQKAAARLCSKDSLAVDPMPAAELARRAQSWAPWRAYAAMALWQSDILNERKK